jgi:hypothetical protein
LAAVSAAVLLVFAEYAWRDRQRIMACALLVLGLAAAAISGSIVLDRVSHTQEARDHKARSANLPRKEAKKALAEAQQELAKAQTEASDACRSGRGTRCKSTEQREDAARQRVAKARSELTGFGAETVIDPTGGILGAHAETFRLIVLLGLPLWLELAAPVVLAYGFAPAPRKEPPPRLKRRRRGKPTRTTKPAAPSGKAAARPLPKLVAANDR